MVTNKLVLGAEKKRIVQYQRERESLRNTIQILSSRVSVLWKIAREKEREISELDGMYKKLRKDFNSFDRVLQKKKIK